MYNSAGFLIDILTVQRLHLLAPFKLKLIDTSQICQNGHLSGPFIIQGKKSLSLKINLLLYLAKNINLHASKSLLKKLLSKVKPTFSK